MQYLGMMEEGKTLEDYFPASDTEEVVNKLARYLEGTDKVVMVARSKQTDNPFLPGVELPIGHGSDGVWVWPLAAGQLVRARKVTPSIEFIHHVLNAGDQEVELTEAQINEAIEVVKSAPNKDRG